MYTNVLASVFLVGTRACVEGSVRGVVGRGRQWGGHLGCRADGHGGRKGNGYNRGHCGGIAGALWGPCGVATMGWGGAWGGSGRGKAMGNGERIGAESGDGLVGEVG